MADAGHQVVGRHGERVEVVNQGAEAGIDDLSALAEEAQSLDFVEVAAVAQRLDQLREGELAFPKDQEVTGSRAQRPLWDVGKREASPHRDALWVGALRGSKELGGLVDVDGLIACADHVGLPLSHQGLERPPPHLLDRTVDQLDLHVRHGLAQRSGEAEVPERNEEVVGLREDRPHVPRCPTEQDSGRSVRR